ncbi:MAG: heme ABC exporter ATP-binding protein CcmA [Coriobacteriales bacterium]|nr:heme ABC exporter ATP-binding protein CcmA [Coriobacteriales bacterium]MBQ6586553.1 heme ABC exporter ATP-binding protein CcmA [Coriobacteriales bacterium]
MTDAIVAKGLRKAFGSRVAVDDLSFTLPKGRFLVVFGPNGAGKTTLLRMLSTLSRPSAGSANILGLDLIEDAQELRRHIGFISHAPMLYPALSASENLLFFARLQGVPNPQARVKDLLDAVELSHRSLDPVSTFSRGMLQRCSIARALLGDPELLLLDEPYSGLDLRAADIFDQLLSDHRADRSIVMVSHDLQHGYDLADQLLLMSRGKLLLSADKDDLPFDEFQHRFRAGAGMAVG